MTAQTTFMVTAPIRQDQLAPLQDLLASMNSAPGFANPRNTLLPFWQFQRLHMARFTILQAHTNDDIRAHGTEPHNWQPTLCFIGDIDGDRNTFLAELVIRGGSGLRRIFAHCEGFNKDSTDLLQWLHNHSHRSNANYVNWRGRTVEQIHEEAKLVAVLSAEVRRMVAEDQGLNNRQIWRRLKRFVEAGICATRLRLSPPAPAPAATVAGTLLHLAAIPILFLLLSPALLLASPFYFYKLRALERADPENTLRPEPGHLQSIAVQEDIAVTNHFNVFGQVKPGLLRLFTIRIGLLLLDYSARHIYTRGHLTRIQTIHFARWVLLDNNRRVYFASNYDGSAESYMDDFINKVAWGLNLVFSNGVGYPRTSWLLKGGAENEENYKKTLRRNQLPSESWYKAYPGLTAVDLARNHRVRQVLESDNPSDGELEQWLALL